MVGSWIFGENLLPALEMISHVVGYEFDSSDRVAIEFGLAHTSSEQDRWFEYPFVGSTPIDLRLAWSDPGDGVVLLEVASAVSDDQAIRIDTILDVFATYLVKPHPFPDWQDP